MLCCIALVSGMALAGALEPAVTTCGVMALGFLLMAGLTRQTAGAHSLIPLTLAFAASGGLVYQARTALPPDDISLRAGQRGLSAVGKVMDCPDDRGWYQRMPLRVELVADASGVPARVSGRVMLTVPTTVELTIGDRVRVSRASVKLPPTSEVPGEFDYRGWLRRKGVTATMNAREVEVIGRDTGARIRLARLGLMLRERVAGGVESAMPGVDGALYSRLLLGMVYGLSAGPLPEGVIEQFRRAGTIHLLVVSGAQISILALVVVGLSGQRLRGGMRWWQGLLTGLCIGMLVLIVGVEASIGRAMAMFALVLMASVTSRDYDVYTAIAFAAAIICIFDPLALSSLSFQLTFAATLGLVLFIPREPLRRISGDTAAAPLPQLRAVFWATTGAWVLTSPVLAHSVAQFAISGNLANLVNVPLSMMIRIIGFVALPVSLLSALSPLAPLSAAILAGLCWLARGLLRLVMHVNSLAISLPVAFAHDLHIGLLGVFICYGAVAGLFALGVVPWMHRRVDELLLRMHPSWPAVGGFGLVTALVVSYLFVGAPTGQLEIAVLPVGAGQAVVMRTPEGRSVMVDCGGGAHARDGREIAEQIVLPHLVARRISELDVVVLSHWHADHFNALPGLLERVGVGLLLTPAEVPGFPPPEALRRWIDSRGRSATAGSRLRLCDDVTAMVLAPRLPLLSGTPDDPNNNSIVMMVEHGDVRILLPGDIAGEGVSRLLRDARAAGWEMRADVLVLPHHGRDLDNVMPLVDASRPKWVIASCNYQADSYLDEEAVAGLTRRGIRLLRTDEHGKVTVFSDGRRLRVSTTRGSLATGAWIEAAR